MSKDTAKSASLVDDEATEPATTTSEAKPEDAADREPRRPRPERAERGERPSPVMTAIRTDEEKSLRDWLDELGTQGAFKVQLRRDKPKTFRDPTTKKEVKVDGYLETYDHTIDEDFIKREWGGGTYYLKITRRSADGSFKFEKGLHRTLEIGGDPLLDRLPVNTVEPTGPASTAPVSESPVVVKEMFGFLRDQMDRTQRPEPKGLDPAVQMMFEQLRADAAARNAELAEARRELAAARNEKPAGDPVKDKLLDQMMSGQSGHVEALRLRYEAELRQTKELAAAELQRARQQAEDDAKRTWDRFERMMTELRSAHERELATVRTSMEVSATATKSSSDVQGRLYESEIRRLERENGELRAELKELRAKKDKTLLEQVKDIEGIKDALGMDGEGEKTGFDKAIDLLNNPATAEFVKGVVGTKGPAAPAPAQPAAPAVPQRPQLAKMPDGTRVWVHPNGQVTPAKKKPKVIPAAVNADGSTTPEIVLPQVDEATMTTLIGYLERAFQAGQEPEIVAQSGRSMVPDEILAWIRDNHTEQVSGVDLFMSKVAKLPGTSPLSAQAGRNWLRKLGKALVGE